MSSSVAMIESAPCKIPGDISLIPNFPEKGAIIFSFLSCAISCPFVINKFLSKSSELIKSSFLILIEKD